MSDNPSENRLLLTDDEWALIEWYRSLDPERRAEFYAALALMWTCGQRIVETAARMLKPATF